MIHVIEKEFFQLGYLLSFEFVLILKLVHIIILLLFLH